MFESINYSFFDGKSILITGGTGTFGKAFTRLLLENSKARRIIIFSRDELKQSQLIEDYKDYKDRVRFFLGDIRDKDRLMRAFKGVDIIAHAAALKHVPILEYNPFEAVKTNVLGTQNIVDAAIDCGVERVLFISTDKAVNPINLYGATKLAAEKLVIAANSYGAGKTLFSVLRYGNVLGSRGSLLDNLKKQMETGSVKLTDERMTRFWIRIEDAVKFAAYSLVNMMGGETFIPRLPSMKIKTLLETLSEGHKIEVVGIRPGEKLHEALITEEEARRGEEFDEIFIIHPDVPENGRRPRGQGKSFPEGFKYASDTNTDWIDGEQLKSLLK